MTFSIIDFEAIRAGTLTIQDVADTMTLDDLELATELSVNNMLAHIAACTDADVTFVPRDPHATEDVRDADGETLGWTLSHVIVHATASSEAGAFAAVDLARGVSLQGPALGYVAPCGVSVQGMSLAEAPWDRFTTIEQCRQRLKESKRMRLASLKAWPDLPDLSNRFTPFPGVGRLNAKEMHVLSLEHDDAHQQQLAEIVQQINACKY